MTREAVGTRARVARALDIQRSVGRAPTPAGTITGPVSLGFHHSFQDGRSKTNPPMTMSCTAIRSSKWQQGFCLWDLKRDLESRQYEDTSSSLEDPSDCIDPDILVYTIPESWQRIIQFPPDDLANVAKAVEGGDTRALGKYKAFRGELDTSLPVDRYELNETTAVEGRFVYQ